MSNNKLFLNFLLPLFLLLVLTGCKKYLEKKPDEKLDIPDSLKDLQAILDNNSVINLGDASVDEVSCDNYYVTAADWTSTGSEHERNQYIWHPENLFAPLVNDWNLCYRIIFAANNVLDNINSIDRSGDIQKWDDVKGQALFHRGRTFFKAATIWCLAYDGHTAENNMGLPLRLNADFNEGSFRANLKETFLQILDDLKKAASLLPATTVHPVRPGKAAAYGMLARVYLYMNAYDEAGLYADSCLMLHNELLDYNNIINPNATYPFSNYLYERNQEIIFESRATSLSVLIGIARAKIDSLLYASFDPDDLRKNIFFRNNNNGTYGFRGNYTGTTTVFTGLATDEIYLIRAETLAREGKVQESLQWLNALLVKRWKTGTFTPIAVFSANEALQHILTERRKELIRRGVRWSDVKRLNKEGQDILQKRIINNNEYILTPGDLRYALPIPADIIGMTGMPQNPR